MTTKPKSNLIFIKKTGCLDGVDQRSFFVFLFCHDDGIIDVLFGLESNRVASGSCGAQEHQQGEDDGKRMVSDQTAKRRKEPSALARARSHVLGLDERNDGGLVVGLTHKR